METFERQETVTTRALVRSVDPFSNRLSVLAGGRILKLRVRGDFADLTKIASGDRLVAVYHSNVTVSVSEDVMGEEKYGQTFRLGEDDPDIGIIGRVETQRVVAELVQYDVRTRQATVQHKKGAYFGFRVPHKMVQVISRLSAGDRLLFQVQRARSISLDDKVQRWAC